MARFPRPFNALTLEEYDALPYGTPVWTVHGHIKPSTPPKRNAREAKAGNSVLYKNHPSFFKGSSQGDSTVFDLAYINEDGTPKMMNGETFVYETFATDWNMVEGTSHNDNYIFATYEDAMFAHDYFVALHDAFPAPNEDMWPMQFIGRCIRKDKETAYILMDYT